MTNNCAFWKNFISQLMAAGLPMFALWGLQLLFQNENKKAALKTIKYTLEELFKQLIALDNSGEPSPVSGGTHHINTKYSKIKQIYRKIENYRPQIMSCGDEAFKKTYFPILDQIPNEFPEGDFINSNNGTEHHGMKRYLNKFCITIKEKFPDIC